MRTFLNTTLLALSIFGFATATIDRGLTQHFKDWLSANGYESQKFDRSDLDGGAFGGKQSDDEKLTHNPVIFFHGNSDIAVGNSWTWQTGFTTSIEYFMSKGYSKGELYITTWGEGNQLYASQHYHSQEYLTYLRAFTEAVLNYTGAEKIDIISHSMGVTLGRKVIKGGKVDATYFPFDLGVSLADKVDTFIGICGANYGLVTCEMVGNMMPTCNTMNGFYPGESAAQGPSTYLNDLNKDGIKEGAKVHALFSTEDDLIQYGDLVYGVYTSKWPTIDDYKMYSGSSDTHIHMRDNTADVQYSLITGQSWAGDGSEEQFM